MAGARPVRLHSRSPALKLPAKPCRRSCPMGCTSIFVTISPLIIPPTPTSLNSCPTLFSPSCRFPHLILRSLLPCSKLCGDLVYVILFPQLLMVVHFRDRVNTYGSFAAFCLGMLVRLLGGEPYIGVPATIHYPFYNEATGQQNFPFRTVAMLVSLSTLILVSAIAKAIFKYEILPARFCHASPIDEAATPNNHCNITYGNFRYDVCRCFNQSEKDEQVKVILNKVLSLPECKEDVSPLKAAESNLYTPANGSMDSVHTCARLYVAAFSSAKGP
ncbi:High-affinity choline transporter 1 [Chionoecetes opilio]|uniref:High-affinity choline transporter 1 n=1 Tax=Chionoecetes opilio TaxID=41210 RepID=A0A8J4Y4P8_CHIOP|nr:High-affinity choline transporter 1 [Chionoecetes opilio]